ncbi:hypothetical protein PAS25_05890 [Leclercia adecarboxylata]|uniref:hypothetical protein n=1 Tax=Leclercia adecarboxylata TaxID=83655 RepID=UPI00111B7E11|nr:hypothetical protein [Leclercia adecarboxylata]QCZ26260.1 hypothetical protein FHN83_06180 [Leclercia adecarboxylata]
MQLNKSRKSIWVLMGICFLMCIALMMIGTFSYLLKGWLIWDFEKPLPFGKKEIMTILKISFLGIPMGMVFWIFGIR